MPRSWVRRQPVPSSARRRPAVVTATSWRLRAAWSASACRAHSRARSCALLSPSRSRHAAPRDETARCRRPLRAAAEYSRTRTGPHTDEGRCEARSATAGHPPRGQVCDEVTDRRPRGPPLPPSSSSSEGTASERRVSVVSGQNLCRALPGAALNFLAPDGAVHVCREDLLLAHDRPFEQDFEPGPQRAGPASKRRSRRRRRTWCACSGCTAARARTARSRPPRGSLTRLVTASVVRYGGSTS
jgi:hypothetical protein